MKLTQTVLLCFILGSQTASAGPDGICPGSAIYHLKGNVGACITKTGQRHGSFVYYPEDGSHVRGQWRRGKRHGGWLIQNTEGVTVGWVEYRHGSGDHQAFYGTGHLREQGILQRGKRVGTWLFFQESGAVEAIVRYRNGKIQGGLVIGLVDETDDRMIVERFVAERREMYRQVIDDEFDPPVPFPPQGDGSKHAFGGVLELGRVSVAPTSRAPTDLPTTRVRPKPTKRKTPRVKALNSTDYIAPREMARRATRAMPRSVRRALGKTPPRSIGAIIRVCTHPTGSVRKVDILRPTNNPVADEELVRALTKLTFKREEGLLGPISYCSVLASG